MKGVRYLQTLIAGQPTPIFVTKMTNTRSSRGIRVDLIIFVELGSVCMLHNTQSCNQYRLFLMWQTRDETSRLLTVGYMSGRDSGMKFVTSIIDRTLGKAIFSIQSLQIHLRLIQETIMADELKR